MLLIENSFETKVCVYFRCGLIFYMYLSGIYTINMSKSNQSVHGF